MTTDNPIQFVLLWTAIILTLAASLYAIIEATQSRGQISSAATNAQKGICILKLSSIVHLRANEKLLTQEDPAGIARSILLNSIKVEKANAAALKNVRGCART